MSKTQIGWYTVRKPEVVHNANFSFAAWWEDIEVKPGKYPVYVYDMEVWRDGQINAQGAYVTIDGTVVADYFAAHFCGMPISDYDTLKNAGKPSSYTEFNYLFLLADDVLKGGSDYELLPEYEAKKYTFTSCIDGREISSAGIFLKKEVKQPDDGR